MIALVAGAGCALALPPYHLLPVLFLAIPGLLRLIDRAAGPRQAARRGWWFGFGLNLVGLYWITDAILIEAARFWWLVPIAVPALSAVLAIFVAVAAAAARLATRGWSRVLALSGAWVLADLARQFFATGFPWNPLGSAWELPYRVGDAFIQPAAWIGVHGLTLATVMIAGAPSLGPAGCVASLVALAMWAGIGLARLDQPAPAGTGLHVLLVQGNVAQGTKWDQARRNAIFLHYLTLTNQAVRSLAEPRDGVVIWPETASPFLLDDDPAARQAIQTAAEGVPSLVGAVRFDAQGRPRNTLFALTGAGEIAAVYDKAHLVPFGEYQPDWLPLGIQLVPGGGFASGPGPQVLTVPGLPPFGALICYEAIFSGQVVSWPARPAWLVNITNDAWFGDSSGPRQHLAAARMRESVRCSMRAAMRSTGCRWAGQGRWRRCCRGRCRRPCSLDSAWRCRRCSHPWRWD
jgi:apolipoprotein N-acyltransferase